jgi:hypothetical protein
LGLILGRRSNFRQPSLASDHTSWTDLNGKVEELEHRFVARLDAIDSRVAEHERRLNDMPPLSAILSATDDAIARKLRGLDEKLTAQSLSIEALRATATQMDDLLPRLLESVEALGHAEEGKLTAGAAG